MQPAVHASSSSRGRVVGFYEDPVDSFSRPVTAAESWACYHFEMHARKCEHCHNPYEVHRNHEQLCDVGHGLAHDVARYLYQRSDGAIYSTTEEDNKLVRVEIPAGYVEVCSLLKAIEHSLRHRSRKPFVSVEVLPNTTPRTTIPVKYPTGMSSTFSVEERPPPLPKASRPVPSHGTAMTRKRPRDDKPTTSPAFNTTHTRGNTLRKREVSHLQYPRLVPGMNIDWPDLTEDIIEDVSSDSSYSTDSEAEDRLGKSEAVQYMNPRGSEYSINRDYDDNMSVTSSNEGSVFSISSLASSATDLSKGSGYSATQIATATRELLSIFRDDSALQPLYAKAIHGAIGPRKFVNAFRRLLKAFADRLKDEAQDRLDFLAARLVALKAREISEAILEIYQLGKAPELDVPEQKESAFTLPDDSSDEDEHEETNVDENIFEELTNIREFLIQSAAFKLLQADLQGYLSSKRRSKKPSIERQADLDSEEEMNGINGPQKLDSQTDAQARSTESTIENDCFEMLSHDRPQLELYLYAFRVLGIDRFVDDFSDLLRHHYSNAHAPLDRKLDSSIEGSIDEQLITTLQPIASAIALRLEIVDANLAFEKDENCGTETNTSFLLELLSREGDDLKCPAPYDNLNRDLALLILREPLRQLLPSIPKRAIDLSSRNDTSLSNKTKAFLEDHTMAEWDWWPLAPRVPDIAYGECRLQWEFGGVQLYETLSSLESNIIRYAMPSLPDHPKQCFCCHLERPEKTSSATSPQSVDCTPEPQTSQWCLSLPMTWSKAAAGIAASPSHSSTASQRYTPTNPSATSTTGTNSAAAGGTSTNASAINNSNSTPQIAGQPATNPSIVVPDPSLRVLFGVQGSRWSLEVEQISTALLNDPAFFRELKTRYKKHRHWIKRLISPFRFRFCRFVKLEKFDAGRVLSQGDDLPDYPGVKDDYEYDPRPGTNPMISPKTFAVCLKACDMNCKWPWINPWHDCVSLPCRSYRLGCIPKKKSEFDIQSDDAIAVAWGLEADHAISFAFMAVYHLVPLLAAFGFWIYWLIKFPGDWQNAAVPVLTVLAIFAVLWVPFGKHLGIV